MRTMPRVRAVDDPACVPEALSVPEVAHHAVHSHGEGGGVGHREWLIEVVEALAARDRRGRDRLVRLPGRPLGRQAGRALRHLVAGARPRDAGVDAQRPVSALRRDELLVLARVDGERRPPRRGTLPAPLPPGVRPGLPGLARDEAVHEPLRARGPAGHAAVQGGLDRAAAAHGARAEAAFEAGTHAREEGERYVRDTILLATVLFLTALAQRFKVRALRLGLIGVLARPARDRAHLHRHLSTRLMRRRASSEKKIVGGNRAQAVQEWLRRPRGHADRAALAAVVPRLLRREPELRLRDHDLLVAVGAADGARLHRARLRSRRRRQRLRAHLVDHLNLTGATAKVVEDTFGSASSNALAASVATIVSFLVWGIGIGQLYQDVYARAWGVTVRSQAADQGRYAIFFFVFSGALALSTIGQAELGDTGRRVLFTTVWLVFSCVFWVAVPRFLLHGQVGVRALLPGALLAAVVLGGAAAFSPLFLPATMNANAKAFGSFGVVLTLIGWLFVLITLSLVCAVFAPGLGRVAPHGARAAGAAAPAPGGVHPLRVMVRRPRLRFNRGERPARRSPRTRTRRTIMCRWLAYSGKSVRIEELLYRPQHSLIVQSLNSTMGAEPTNGDGFGIGWYGVGESRASSTASSRPGTTATCTSSRGTSSRRSCSRTSAPRPGARCSRRTATRSATRTGCSCTTA